MTDTRNSVLVDKGALTMALNVLRRAGKEEVAAALESAINSAPQTAPAGQVEPDLRGIDAGDVDEWLHLIRHGLIPRKEILIRASDAVAVARRVSQPTEGA